MSNTIPQTTPNVKLKKTSEHITARAGLIPMLRAVKNAEAFERVCEPFTGMKQRERGLSSEEKVLNFFAHALSGANRLEDFNVLKADTALSLASGVRFMKATTAGEFLRSINEEQIGELRNINFENEMAWYEKENVDEICIDTDSSIFETGKKDTEYSYKGVKGYHPMFFIESGKKRILDANFRTGNKSASADINEPLARILERFHFAKTVHVRGDSAFYQTEFIRKLTEDERVRFSITAKQDVSVKETICTISDWSVLDEEDESEVGETTGIVGDVPYRMVVKRFPKREIKEEQQRRLFSDEHYEYYAVATNFAEEEKSPAEVIRFHNKRANAENIFKELKNDFTLHRFPCSDYNANAAYFYLRVIAFNFLKTLFTTAFFPASYSRCFLGTIIYRFINIAAKLVSHARQLHLAISESTPEFDAFKHALSLSSHRLF